MVQSLESYFRGISKETSDYIAETPMGGRRGRKGS